MVVFLNIQQRDEYIVIRVLIWLVNMIMMKTSIEM